MAKFFFEVRRGHKTAVPRLPAKSRIAQTASPGLNSVKRGTRAFSWFGACHFLSASMLDREIAAVLPFTSQCVQESPPSSVFVLCTTMFGRKGLQCLVVLGVRRHHAASTAVEGWTSGSLYERIGGAAAVEAAVNLFYDKIMADSRVNYFFEKTDMSVQRNHQKSFLTLAFGGPVAYGGQDMREVAVWFAVLFFVPGCEER